MSDFDELQRIVSFMNANGLSEFELEEDGRRVRLRKAQDIGEDLSRGSGGTAIKDSTLSSESMTPEGTDEDVPEDEAMNRDESTNSNSSVAEVDYGRHRIVINATTEAERRWRARACAKEPWTVEWIETSVNQGDVFCDIGANVGVFSLIAAMKCTKKLQVVAFEPGYASFAHLCDNVVLNHCEGVITPIPLPLSDQTGLAQFKYRSREAGQSRHALLEKTRIGPGDGESRYQQPVLAMRLDDMVSTFNLPKPTHLKIDVDGAELRVLHGATEVLRHDGLRTILIEVETAIEDSVVAVLRDAGFSLVSRYEHGKNPKAPWYGLFARVSETGADSLS